MAPSLSAIAIYRTERAAQIALESLERKGFVIKEILAPPDPQLNAAPRRSWDEDPEPVSVALYVSNEASPSSSTLEASYTITPGRHIVIVENHTKERAIETLSSQKPLRMYRY